MSLILDALKRAERERKAQSSPALADLAPAPRVPTPVRRQWRIAGIALLTLIAGLLLWTLLRDQPRPAPEAVTGASTALPAPPVQVPSVIPGTEAVASLDDLTDEPVEEMEPLPPPAGTTLPEPAVRPAQPGAKPEVPAPEPQEQVAPATPAPSSAATAPEPEVVPEIPPALTQPAPLRKLREMPPDYRADFPALSVEVHVYEREIAKRMVMINGRRYREGERLAEGPLLLEIVRDGIVFEHRGEKVLYTLGR
jgi:general secretion pathway protein B